MKRETAEIIVDALQATFERLGINFDKALSEAASVRWALPKGIAKYLRYGNDRESVIKYLAKHVAEPNNKDLAALPAASFAASKVIRASTLETAKDFPRTGNYRRLSPKEHEKVCKEVQRLMKSKSFPRAIEQVAHQRGVHPRTIRRIWKAWPRARH
jgi:hypothetical protein